MTKIFLIGLPGSGKTTLAKSLADELGITFVDLDAVLAQKEGQAVKSIFATKGEEYFRSIESETLGTYCQQRVSFVMAVGGGAPCFHDNMKRMNDAGMTVFIDVPTVELLSRLKDGDLSERPLFAGLDESQLAVKIEALRSQRGRYYGQAKRVLSGTDLSVSALAKLVRE